MIKRFKNKKALFVFLLIIGLILLRTGTTTFAMNLRRTDNQPGHRNDCINPSLSQNSNLAVLNLESHEFPDYIAPLQIEPTPKVKVLLFKFLGFADTDLTIEKGKIESYLNDDLALYWQQASYGNVNIDFTLQTAPARPAPAPDDGWYVLNSDRDAYPMESDPRTLLDEVHNTAGPFPNDEYVLIWVNDEFYPTEPTPTYTPPTKDAFFTQGPDGMTIGTAPQSESKLVAVLGVDNNDFNPTLTPDEVIWGKAAHVLGHLFGFEHTHSVRDSHDFDDPVDDSRYALMGRYLPLNSLSADRNDINYPVDLSIFSRTIQLETQNWQSSFNIKEIYPAEWGSYDVLPRSHQSVTGSNQWQCLNIFVDSTGSSYYGVEVIDNTLNDELTPGQGVLIYKVTADNRIIEIDRDTDEPVGPLPTDKVDILYDTSSADRSSFVDDRGTTDNTADDITIEITQFLNPGYRIMVTNEYTPTPPDLMIEPWGRPPYESVDIWIDSPGNGYDVYQTEDPDGNRDMPALWHGDIPGELPNRFYARITNLGDLPATGVIIRYWDRMLTAGAGTGFREFDTYDVGTLNGHTTEEFWVEWRPTVGIDADPISGIGQTPGGACLYANVTANNEADDRLMNNGLKPDWVGDPSDRDLRAQENVHHLIDLQIGPQPVLIGETQLMLFHDGGEPVFNLANKYREITFDIGNPFDIGKQIYVDFIDRNNNWNLSCETEGINDFHYIPASENVTLTLRLRPNLNGTQVGDLLKAAITVSHIQVMGGEIGLIPFGGFEIWGRVVHQTNLLMAADVGRDSITVSGSLSVTDLTANISAILSGSHNGTRAIRIDFRDRQTKGLIKWDIAYLEDSGAFVYRYSNPKPRKYSIYAMYYGSEKLGPSVSSVDEVEITEESNWNLSISIGAIFLLAIVYRSRKRKFQRI